MRSSGKIDEKIGESLLRAPFRNEKTNRIQGVAVDKKATRINCCEWLVQDATRCCLALAGGRQVGTATVGHFRRHADGFAKRGVRVDGAGDINDIAAHLDG